MTVGRMGRELRSRAPPQLVRRHRRGADLPRRAAGRGAACPRPPARGHRSAAGATVPGPGAEDDLRAVGPRGDRRVPPRRDRVASRRRSSILPLAPPRTGADGGGLAAGLPRVGTGAWPARRCPGRATTPTRRHAARRTRRGRGQRCGSSTPRRAARTCAIPTLPAPFQTLPLRAIGDGTARTLTWTVDGRTVGRSALDAAIDWPLSIGPHTIAVTDDAGRTHETSILVK